MKTYLKTITFLFFFFSISNSIGQNTGNVSENSEFLLKSDKPKFQISFPCDYKLEDSKKEKGLKTEFYQGVKGDNVYMFKFTEHKNPAVSSDNKMYMEASLESFINGIQADLIKKYEFKQKKQKGLEALLKISDKNLNVFYRVLIVKHIQYQIIVITKSSKKTSDIIHFFDSFELH